MTKPGRIFFIALTIVVALATGGLFYLHNENQQVSEQQALASLDQGIALFREKKFNEALDVLQGIPDDAIRDWHLPYYTASTHVMLKDFEAAVPELEEALALNPQETQILFELGVVYYKLGNIGLSKAYFASVVELDPSNAEAKGLMDIMANLERQQRATSSESSPKENSGADGN